ncbi:MAG: hypothetical protein ABJE95_13720 [Byssovorax sp.]
MSDKDVDRRTRKTSWIPRIESLLALRTWGFIAPTLCALILVGVGRYYSSYSAISEIADLARIVKEVSEHRSPTRCDIPLDDLDPIVNDVIRSQYGAPKESPTKAEIDARLRARALTMTVANQLGRQIAKQENRCAPWLPSFSRDVTDDLRKSFGLGMILITIVLGSLAGLFIADLYRARRDLRASGCFQHGSHASLEEEIAWERNWRTLEQPSQFFARRLGFSLLIATGASYILSPIGIQASIFGDYTKLHPILGTASVPFFVDQAEQASPVAIGFCGFMVYSLLTLADRAVHRDLDDRLFIALLNRGIVVVILSLVLTSVTFTGGESVSRALIFLVGVFPKSGIDAIAKMAQIRVEKITSDEVAGFEVLRDINFPKGVTLRELGINDANDLAKADVHELVLRVGMAPQMLFDAVDQAVLIRAFGPLAAKKLESVPLFTATQLLSFVGNAGERRPANLAIAVEAMGVKDISVQLQEIESDANVIYLLQKKLDYYVTA